MPFLSIIIPVYGVQGYLRECLDSVLDQSFTDIEVIAVDDRSPDHCPQILDEYTQRDPRVRIIHLDQNVGNGHARNIGLDHATGEYIWFVDSDDWLAPGAVQAVVTALGQRDLDVLLVDHTRVDPFGGHTPGKRGRLPGQDGAPGVTVVENPRLLNVFTVAWNKIVRREFLVDAGIRFDVGWYEDIPFTYPVLVAAQRIGTMNRVCYHYRRRRQDAITQTRSARHFEVFDQWSRVFDRLDQMARHHGADERWHGADGAGHRAVAVRDEIFRRMVWHLRVVLAMPDRLPADKKRAFFHRMSRHYHWYRPLGYAAPADTLERLRHRLIASDSYRTFQQLRACRVLAKAGRRRAKSVVRRLRSVAGTLLRRGQMIVGVALYHLLRLLPVNPRLAVYAAYWYRGYACNPAAVYEKARELVPHVQGVWVVDRRHADTMPAGVSYVVDGSLRYYRALARARWLVNNVNFPDFVVKRPGTTYLQTHHGTPVKVMGLDQNAFPVLGQDSDLAGLLRRSDRWDFSVTANAHSTEVWSRAYPCRYETLEHGYPRNDRLARATRPDGAADVAATRRRLGLPDDATVVLYAPTHREYVSGFRPLLDVDEFARSVGPRVVVLQRAHYFYGQGKTANTPIPTDPGPAGSAPAPDSPGIGPAGTSPSPDGPPSRDGTPSPGSTPSPGGTPSPDRSGVNGGYDVLDSDGIGPGGDAATGAGITGSSSDGDLTTGTGAGSHGNFPTGTGATGNGSGRDRPTGAGSTGNGSHGDRTTDTGTTGNSRAVGGSHGDLATGARATGSRRAGGATNGSVTDGIPTSPSPAGAMPDGAAAMVVGDGSYRHNPHDQTDNRDNHNGSGDNGSGDNGSGDNGSGDNGRGDNGRGDGAFDDSSVGDGGCVGKPPCDVVRDVSQYPVVEDLMVAADVLITDYSSVMFDYAVLDRPAVIYAPDWDSYVQLRGVTFDLLAQPPGVVATNQGDLVDAFRTGTVWGDDATQARARFRERFAYLDDGNASERVVRQVFSSELEDEETSDADRDRRNEPDAELVRGG